MSLRDWIASFSIPATATPATTATDTAERGQLSQLSQLSQSQESAGASPASGEDAREAFEERAAIMEYDGGMTRADAERLAGEAVQFSDQYARTREAGEPTASEAGQAAGSFERKYARAREAGEPPTSEAGQWSEDFVTKCAHAREAAINNPEITRDLPTKVDASRSPRLASELFPPRAVPDEWGDMRPCEWCRNLTRSGRCMAAWRGELRAARDWGPTFPGQPQRCYFYDPKASDPDQQPGSERWPELANWQARIKVI